MYRDEQIIITILYGALAIASTATSKSVFLTNVYSIWESEQKFAIIWVKGEKIRVSLTDGQTNFDTNFDSDLARVTLVVEETFIREQASRNSETRNYKRDHNPLSAK